MLKKIIVPAIAILLSSASFMAAQSVSTSARTLTNINDGTQAGSATSHAEDSHGKGHDNDSASHDGRGEHDGKGDRDGPDGSHSGDNDGSHGGDSDGGDGAGGDGDHD